MYQGKHIQTSKFEHELQMQKKLIGALDENIDALKKKNQAQQKLIGAQDQCLEAYRTRNKEQELKIQQLQIAMRVINETQTITISG